ncbi:MAG: peptide chain release factor N(5)-glutamine methyltransferase [FCB group bacterium]|nr:peptide chain release factor N(5)-glutamine methyltransferase [FCB group bacterium]
MKKSTLTNPIFDSILPDETTRIQLLRSTIEQFQLAGIRDPDRDAELLLCRILNINHIKLYFDREKTVHRPEIRELNEIIRRRTQGEPLQYILGETEFYGLPFKCDTRALIPRPETEILVDTALKFIEENDYSGVIDIGTGSGAIAVSIAVNTDCRITAADKSESALKLALNNARLNSVDSFIDFVQADIFAPDFPDIAKKGYDMLVCNPPYVALDEIDSLDDEIKNYEPWEALTDYNDGLNFYRRLKEIIPEIVKIDGIVIVELAENRAAQAKSILSPILRDVKIIPDLAGKLRVLCGKRSSK